MEKIEIRTYIKSFINNNNKENIKVEDDKEFIKEIDEILEEVKIDELYIFDKTLVDVFEEEVQQEVNCEHNSYINGYKIYRKDISFFPQSKNKIDLGYKHYVAVAENDDIEELINKEEKTKLLNKNEYFIALVSEYRASSEIEGEKINKLMIYFPVEIIDDTFSLNEEAIIENEAEEIEIDENENN